MFEIGDRICYPMYGSGTIEAIELNKENSLRYYSIIFVSDNLKIMVPVSKADIVGMRRIMTFKEAQEIITALEKFVVEKDDESKNWNKRSRENLEKLKTGKLDDLIDVIATLAYKDRSKGLSIGEKKMLTSARKIFESELVMSGVGESDIVANIIDIAITKINEV